MNSDPSSSNLSLRYSDYPDDSKHRKSKSKRHNKKKNNWKCTKQDSSDSSLRDSNFSDEIDYKSKIHN